MSFYETRGEQFQRDEAIRNASISSMMFMLAAKGRRPRGNRKTVQEFV